MHGVTMKFIDIQLFSDFNIISIPSRTQSVFIY